MSRERYSNGYRNCCYDGTGAGRRQGPTLAMADRDDPSRRGFFRSAGFWHSRRSRTTPASAVTGAWHGGAQQRKHHHATGWYCDIRRNINGSWQIGRALCRARGLTVVLILGVDVYVEKKII